MSSEGTIPGTHVCSEEEQKRAWMRETRIRTFMQVELETCRDELDWLIRCHNCAAYNCPEEEYPPRHLPIPPDYIENLQSRLGRVMKVILSPTLKMILNPFIHSNKKFHHARKRSRWKHYSKCSPMT